MPPEMLAPLPVRGFLDSLTGGVAPSSLNHRLPAGKPLASGEASGFRSTATDKGTGPSTERVYFREELFIFQVSKGSQGQN